MEEVEHYLHYVGGGAGALALTGVAAVSALYLASRPTGEEPLVPLEQQCKIVGVSNKLLANYWKFRLDKQKLDYENF